jgi:cation/acetate symporter
VAAIVTGTVSAVVLIFVSPTIQIDILHTESAWFPLRNPALVSMPLAFVVSIVVSLLKPEAAAQAGYEAKERRMILGEQ